MKCMEFEVVKGNGKAKMLFLANAPIYAAVGDVITVPKRYAYNLYNIYKNYVTPKGEVEKNNLKHNFYEVFTPKKEKAMQGDEIKPAIETEVKKKARNKSMRNKGKAKVKADGDIS